MDEKEYEQRNKLEREATVEQTKQGVSSAFKKVEEKAEDVQKKVKEKKGTVGLVSSFLSNVGKRTIKGGRAVFSSLIRGGEGFKDRRRLGRPTKGQKVIRTDEQPAYAASAGFFGIGAPRREERTFVNKNIFGMPSRERSRGFLPKLGAGMFAAPSARNKSSLFRQPSAPPQLYRQKTPSPRILSMPKRKGRGLFG